MFSWGFVLGHIILYLVNLLLQGNMQPVSVNAFLSDTDCMPVFPPAGTN
jgi:hypothetical protein